MCGIDQAKAQGMPKAPPPPGRSDPITPEPYDSVMRGLKEIEDPNPDRFKPKEPLFPKGDPKQPDKRDGEKEDDSRRTRPPATMDEWRGF